MRLLSAFLLAAILVAFSGPSSAQSVVSRLLEAQNNSGQTGLISITPDSTGSGIIVNVSVVGEPANGNEPMHIHTGTCGPNLGGVYKPLSNVVNGHSLTTVTGMTINDLMRGTYAINVHRGPGPLAAAPYVACANISKVAVQPL